MTRQALVEAWFDALDSRNLASVKDLLTETASLSIETHGIHHEGRDAIAALFEARWESDWPKVRHHDLMHVANRPETACQFTVTYTNEDGSTLIKTNANFFTLEGDKIAAIRIYMSGENTIKA